MDLKDVAKKEKKIKKYYKTTILAKYTNTKNPKPLAVFLIVRA